MAALTIASKDLRLLARDPRAAVVLVGMPLLLILVLGLTLGEGFGKGGDAKLRISVLNLDAGLPKDAGPFPGKPWSEVVIGDLSQTAGVRVELLPDRATAEELIRRGERPAVVVLGERFSREAHRCTFLGGDAAGVNPFYRDGIDLRRLDVAVLRDPTQAVGSAVVDQLVQVSLLRVVMPWMIGRAFDRVAETLPLGGARIIQGLFSRYDLRAKTWADLTQSRRQTMLTLGQLLMARAEPTLSAAPWGGFLLLDAELSRAAAAEDYAPDGAGWLKSGAARYQILVPSYAVMFAYFLVLTCGWLFVAERRQGTLVRLKAAPVSRSQVLLGKTLPCLLVAVAQGVLLFVAGKVLFGMDWGVKPWLLLPVVLATAVSATGLSLLVAGMARTETQVAVYGTLLVLALAGLSGTLMPREFLPEEMRAIRLLTPHAWAVDAYAAVLGSPDPDAGIVLGNCGVLLAFGAGFFALAWWRLRL